MHNSCTIACKYIINFNYIDIKREMFWKTNFTFTTELFVVLGVERREVTPVIWDEPGCKIVPTRVWGAVTET